jgi:hypothetical protein
VHDAKSGVETFRVAHEDDLGPQRRCAVVSRSALRVDAGELGIERRRFQPSPPIRGVRARLRCCCPTPGPEVYRDGCRPSVPTHGNKGSRNIAPFGQSGPAAPPAAGPCCVRLSVSAGTGRAAALRRVPRDTGSGARPRASLGQDNGGRAPSINIGAGRSSLECSTEMVSSECMRQVRPRAVSLAPL